MPKYFEEDRFRKKDRSREQKPLYETDFDTGAVKPVGGYKGRAEKFIARADLLQHINEYFEKRDRLDRDSRSMSVMKQVQQQFPAGYKFQITITNPSSDNEVIGVYEDGETVSAHELTDPDNKNNVRMFLEGTGDAATPPTEVKVYKRSGEAVTVPVKGDRAPPPQPVLRPLTYIDKEPRGTVALRDREPRQLRADSRHDRGYPGSRNRNA